MLGNFLNEAGHQSNSLLELLSELNLCDAHLLQGTLLNAKFTFTVAINESNSDGI